MAKYQGNKGLEYYKAYPRDFFEGVVGMDGPLRGFYRMVIDLIYMHDGFLIPDWNHISGHTGFGKTQCRRMMDQLIERGKIEVLEENERFFTQKRAKNELKTSRKHQEKQANNAASRWKNNNLGEKVAMPNGIPPQDHKTTRPQYIKKRALRALKKDPDFLPAETDDRHDETIIEEAFDQWWSLYPRKDAKASAKKAFIKACKKHGPQIVCEGMQWQLGKLKRSKADPDGNFCPMASTFLNQERFLDEKPQRAKTAPTDESEIPF